MKFNAIGLMSGTSLDGLDICYATFQKNENGNWHFQILNAETESYSEIWENKLRNAIHLKPEDLFELNSDFGFYLGEKVKNFIQNHQIQNLDVIASHGHTVFHQPKRKFTVQIGDGRAIKILNNIPVVYDYRSQDVLLGGNGAPLVPIGDKLLFHEYDACLNLGGFSNISFEQNGKRMAFDISPVNTVLNFIAEKRNLKFDQNGAIAKSGEINLEILEQLNSLSYYSEKPPKSLGIELVNQDVFPILEKLNIEDALATFTEHTSKQISEVFQNYNLRKILFTGGGTYNDFLIEQIQSKTNAEIIIPDQKIIDFKEALIFGFMGVLRILDENNVLNSATGSKQDHCTGILV